MFPRTTNPYGWVTLPRAHGYVEAGLPQPRVLWWVYGEQGRAVLDHVVLAQSQCRYDWRQQHVTAIRDGVVYPTRLASPPGALIPVMPQGSCIVYRPKPPGPPRLRPCPVPPLWLFELIPTASCDLPTSAEYRRVFPHSWQGCLGQVCLEELRLLNAVQKLRVRRGPGTDQGLRNHALFAALLGSGLRVSEVVNLDKDQYTGKGFSRVQIKGGVIRDFVAAHRDARQILDEWLKARQDDSPALFPTRTGRKLSRCEAYGIVCRVAAQANAHLPEEEKIDVSPLDLAT